MAAWNTRANQVFLGALEIDDSAARREYLRRECGPDSDLLRQVEALLAAHAAAGSFLEQPADWQQTGAFVSQPDAAPIVGTTIGHFKLLQLLGEGGMGTVWVAEQSVPVKRRVALKLIKAGMDSAQVLRRFEAERQALALMDHPNIAKVLDAGATPQGRPFFAMELIKGIPITRYCDQEHLTPRERLELFIPVCQAVQHAHQKGVIHRDLKPSNVLIALYDGKPVPKVIDFGVAKATSQKLTERTIFTEVGQIVGTLEYMAPEQAELNNLDIDTRADIYSLGVILYELLAGSPPFSAQQLRGAAFTEMLRMIREVEPPKPSTRLSASNELPSIAANRKLEPNRLTRAVHGDLDWIVMKALEKDRGRRYATANGFAEDVQRYLADEPVLAGPPRAGYRLRKFARKHRGFLTAVAAAVALLAAAAVGGTWLAFRATRAEAIAREERDKTAAEADVTRAVNGFMVTLFSSANPFQQDGRQGRPDPDIRVRTIVDQAARQLDGQFAEQPLVRAGVHLTLGAAYYGLGLYAESLRQAESAYQIHRRELGPDHPGLRASLNNLGACYNVLGRKADAERVYTEGLEIGRHHSIDDYLTHSLEINLALVLKDTGKVDRAEEILTRSLEDNRRTHGDDSAETARAIFRLALLYRAKQQFDRVEVFAKDARDRYRAKFGPEHPHTLSAITELASAYWVQRKYALVEPLLLENLAANRRVWGDAQLNTVEALDQLARLYLDWGQFARAEPVFIRVLEDAKRTHGPEHRFTLSAMEHLAMAYLPQRKYAEAETLLAGALVIGDRVLPEGDNIAVSLVNDLGNVYWRQAKYALAEPIFARAVAANLRANGAASLATLATQTNLSNVQFVQGRYAEAEANYTRALVGLRALPNAEEAALQTIHNLGELNLAIGRLDRAEQFLTEAIAGFRRIRKEGHPEILNSLSFLVAVREEQGRLVEADALCTQMLETRRTLSHSPADVAATLSQLGRIRLKQGKAVEAEAPLRESVELWAKAQPDGVERFLAQSLLGGSLLGQKKYAEAEPLVVGGYEGMAARKAFIWAQFAGRLTEARDRGVQLYEGWGNQEKAAAWRLKPAADALPGATARPTG